MDRFSGVELNEARIYAAKINHRLADSAFDADFGFASHVTNTDKTVFVEKQRKYAKEIECGMHDTNLTIKQRMLYYLTGECTAILP